MVPYVVALLLLVTTSFALKGNKQFMRPQNEAPLLHGDIAHIKGEYVVVLKTNADVAKHVEKLRQSLSKDESIIAEFDFEPFKAYGAKLIDKTVTALRANGEVDYIEHNIEAKLSVCTEQNGAPWGIRRTVKNTLPLQNTYSYNAPTAGATIDVYVIDSGIDVTHVDFGGRASWGSDLVHAAHSANYQRDLNGHGTHVAGTIMSATYGMAKSANAIAVKIFDAAGSANTIRLIRGIDYVVANDRYKRRRDQNRRVAVINMSFGMPKTRSVNEAVDAAIGAGLVVIAAAGNSQADACNYSPASAPRAVTVMASQANDQFATGFSNFGRCTHIIAPGVNVDSTQAGGGHHALDGTSMAAPHVSGAVAKYLSGLAVNAQPTPAQVKTWLVQAAGNGLVTNVPLNTPNKLLHYKDC